MSYIISYHILNHISYRILSHIIIIIIINCNWVVTRWQWLFYMYTKYEIGYTKHGIGYIYYIYRIISYFSHTLCLRHSEKQSEIARCKNDVGNNCYGMWWWKCAPYRNATRRKWLEIGGIAPTFPKFRHWLEISACHVSAALPTVQCG